MLQTRGLMDGLVFTKAGGLIYAWNQLPKQIHGEKQSHWPSHGTFLSLVKTLFMYTLWVSRYRQANNGAYTAS